MLQKKLPQKLVGIGGAEAAILVKVAHQVIEVVGPAIGRDVLAELHAAVKQRARLGFQRLEVDVEQWPRRQEVGLSDIGRRRRAVGGGDAHGAGPANRPKGRRAKVIQVADAAGGVDDTHAEGKGERQRDARHGQEIATRQSEQAFAPSLYCL